jgi:hypothetical protein
MDDELINRRFWFEHESGRRLFPQRQKNRQTGRALFRIGKGKGANRVENQLELDDVEEVFRRVFNDGWLVRMRADDGWHGMYGKDGPTILRTSEDQSRRLTAADYQTVLENLPVSEKAKEFLAAHYYSPNRQASMEALADAVGYDTYAPANLHYGALAHRIADNLPTSPSDVPGARYANWMQALAYSNGERNGEGHFLWMLRPEIAMALERLGWVAPDVSEITQEQDGEPSAEDDAEPQSTTREASIQVRRGQALFRSRVLQYWGGRCAVTGCAITGILVASHIKPWAISTNVERLDGFNGLLLTPNLDKLFDTYMISFDGSGELLVSQKLPIEEQTKLGLVSGMRLQRLHERHRPYLEAHRDQFLGRTMEQPTV